MKDGHIQFRTGDKLIDRWEEQIARGEDPDLTEGWSAERLVAESRPTKGVVDSFAQAQQMVDSHVAKEKYRLDNK